MRNEFIYIAASVKEAVLAQKAMLDLGMVVKVETWGGSWESVRNGRSGELIFGNVRIVNLPPHGRSNKVLASVDGNTIAIRPIPELGNHQIRLVGATPLNGGGPTPLYEKARES